MLNIFPGESLHGYVLRNIISHGLANNCQDIKGIISNLGIMRSDLYLTEQQSKVFSALPVTTLMELLKNHLPITNLKTYSHPKALAEICGKIFFHKKTCISKHSGYSNTYTYLFGNPIEYSNTYQRLNYCPLCIKNNIKNNGFGWIKLAWLDGKTCTEHNITLVSIHKRPCSCKLDIFEKIVSTLSGVCTSCKSEEISLQEKYDIDNSLANLMLRFVRSVDAENEVSTAACFVSSFEKWVRLYFLKLEKDVLRYAYVKIRTMGVLEKLTYSNGSERKVSPVDLLHMLSIMEKFVFEEVREFIDEHSEVKPINCNDCVPAEFFVDFRVSKDRDCLACKMEIGSCPLKI